MKLISIFWSKRSTLEKLFLLIILVGGIYGTYLISGKAWYKYKYYQELEQKYTVIKDSLGAAQLKIKDLTITQENRTKIVQKKAKATNDKLKSDEAIIDNRIVTDDELDDFLSKYDQD